MAGGIAVKVFADLELATVAAAVLQMKNIWGKAGKEISGSMATDLKAAQEQAVRSANDMARAEIAAYKAAADEKIKIRRAQAAAEKTIAQQSAADQRALYALPIASMKADYADAQLAAATAANAKASDDHAKALKRQAGEATATGAVLNRMGMLATGAFALIGGASIDAATKYEAGLTRIQAATDISADSIAKLQSGLLTLSTQLGVNLKDLNDAAYATVKAGGGFRDAGTALNFLSEAAKLAKIDMVPLSTVVEGGTTTINDFNIAANRAVDALARLKTAAGELKGRFTIGDLSSSLENVEPRFAAATTRPGMSQDQRLSQESQMLTMITRITQQSGATPQQATQWLDNAIAHMTNPNAPQAQFMGGMLAKIGLAPSDLQAAMADPGKGPLWVMKTLQDAMNANMGANGKIGVPIRQMDADIIAKLSAARNTLKSPELKATADALIADAQSGVIPDKDLVKASRFAQRLPEFMDFMNIFHGAAGFSQSFKAKGVPMELEPAQAWNLITGSASGNITGLEIAGTPQNWQQTQAAYRRQQGSSMQDVEDSFNLVKNTAQWKLEDTKAQLHALGVVIGQELLPHFKQFLDMLRGLFDFLSSHKGVLDGFVNSMEAIAAIWAGGKIISGIQGTINAYKSLTATTLAANAAMEASGAAAQAGATGVTAAAAVEAGALARVRAVAMGLVASLAGIAGKIGVVGTALTLWNLKGSGPGAQTTPEMSEMDKRQRAIKLWQEQNPGKPLPPGTAQWIEQPAEPGGPIGRGPVPPELANLYNSMGISAPIPSDIFPQMRAPFANNGWNFTGPKTPDLTAGIPDFGQEGPIPSFDSGGGKKAKRSPLGDITDPSQIQMPDGTADDPLFVDPANGFTNLMGSNTGPGTGDPFSQFTNPKGLWGKHGLFGDMAGLMTTFLAELALGNPYGHMMTEGKYGKKGMFGKAEESSNRLANAFDRVREALARGYGPGTPQYDIAARNFANAQISAGRAGVGPSGMVGGGVPGFPGMGTGTAGGGLLSALSRAGIDPRMFPMLQGFAKTEGNNPSGAPTLGFTDSQAGTTLDSHAAALAAQIQARQSVAGPFPFNGSPQDQASWMATVVGQNGVASDWQGNAQPPRQTYVNNIVGGMVPASPFNPGMSSDRGWGGGKSGPGGFGSDFFGAGGSTGFGGFPLSPGSKGRGGWGSGGRSSPGVGAGLGRSTSVNPSLSGFDTGAQKPGFSISGLLGETIGSAAAAGGIAADAFAPGSGAAVQAAAQIIEQEANRAAQTAGEVAADLAGQLPLETFFLSGKDLSGKNVNMANSFIGKVAGGLLGAHSTASNSAGGGGLSDLLTGGLDPSKTNPAMKKADNKDPNVKDGNNNNYGVNVENIHMNNGQNMDDLHKGLNQQAMAMSGGPGISRGQY